MPDFYWINNSDNTYRQRKNIVEKRPNYGEIEYTSYEKSDLDETYLERQRRLMKYSDSRNEALKEQYRQLYEEGDYDSELRRRNLARLLNYAFPEFSEDYFYNNAQGFIKSATGIDADIDTYSEHINNVWNSTWKSTKTSLDLAMLYMQYGMLGTRDNNDFNNDKRIIMNRIRTNGQEYRKQDYEDNYGFLGKAFSKLVEQSPNLLVNFGLSLATGFTSMAVSPFVGASVKASTTAAKIINNTRVGLSAAYAGLTEMGSTALEMSQHGFDDDIIYGVSLLQGAFTGALETLWEDKVFSPMNNFVDNVFDIAGSDTHKIVDASFKGALKQFGSSYLKELAQEPSEEGLESISGNALYNLGVALQDKNKEGFDAKYKSVNDFVSEALENAKEALWSTSLSAFGGATIDIAGDYVVGAKGKSLRSSKYMLSDDADVILRTDNLKKSTNGIKPATKEEIEQQKASPINVTKVGSSYYPKNVDARQKYAINNGKYVFAKEEQSSLLTVNDIDSAAEKLDTLSPKKAEAVLQIMYKNNAVDSYAYLDSSGKVMADNNSNTAVTLVMRNSNGTDYFAIDPKKKNNKKTANNTTENNTNNTSSTANTAQKPNNTNQANTIKTQTHNTQNEGINLMAGINNKTKSPNSVAQSAIQAQLSGKVGIVTFKQFVQNVYKMTKDKPLYAETDYFFVDSSGRILADEEDARYIAFRRNGNDSFDIIKLSNKVTPKDILNVFSNKNKSSTEVKAKANKQANDTASALNPSSTSQIKVETNADNKQVETKTEETPTNTDDIKTNEETATNKQDNPQNDTQPTLVNDEQVNQVDNQSDIEQTEEVIEDFQNNTEEQTYENSQPSQENEKNIEVIKEQEVEYLNDSQEIKHDENTESSKLNSSDINDISIQMNGTADERQKKTNVVQVVADISDSNVEEIVNEVNSKEIPTATKKDTKESYLFKIADFMLNLKAVNNKTNMTTLFGKNYETVDKKTLLSKMLTDRLNGKEIGSKRTTLIDRLLNEAKAQWITDRQSTTLPEDFKTQIDEYLGVDDNTVIETSAKTTKEAIKEKLKDLEPDTDVLDLKTASQIASNIIDNSIKQRPDGTLKEGSLSHDELSRISQALYKSNVDFESYLTEKLANAIKTVKEKFTKEGLKSIKNVPYIQSLVDGISETKSQMLSLLNSENSKKAIDAYFDKIFEGAVARYALDLNDKNSDTFFNEGKTLNGKPVNLDAFLQLDKPNANDQYNWNYTETRLKKYIDKKTKDITQNVIDAKVTKQTEQDTTDVDEDFNWNDEPFERDKNSMFVEVNGNYLFNHYAVEKKLNKLGFDDKSAKLIASLLTSYSPEVQNNIYLNAGDSLFKKGKLKNSELGRFVMEDEVTGYIIINEKTDVPTIVHEGGHFVWHTNPKIVEDITTAFNDALSEDKYNEADKKKYKSSSPFDNLKKYVEERINIFKALRGPNFDVNEELKFMQNFAENHSSADEIVVSFWEDNSNKNKDKTLRDDQIHFEELVITFLECYHADNEQSKLGSFPTKIKNAFKELADVFRKAFAKMIGVEYTPNRNLNDEIIQAFNEIYMDNESVPKDLKPKQTLEGRKSGNKDLKLKQTLEGLSRRIFLPNGNFMQLNDRNVDTYTDYYVSQLVSIDKSHGKTSTSYDKAIKKILPTRRKGIFRDSDINVIKAKLEYDGFFENIDYDFRYLDSATRNAMKDQITKKLVYSRQTPIQEAYRLRTLADAFKNASTLKDNKTYLQKKDGKNWVNLTIDDIRAMKDSEKEQERNMYKTLTSLESFFWGDQGWLSEINKRASDIDKQNPRSSKRSRVIDRITDNFMTIDSDYFTNKKESAKEILFSNRQGFAGNVEVEDVIKLIDMITDEKGNPIVWTGEASTNSPLHNSGSLFRGPLVDILNYAMASNDVVNYNKESYSTVDQDYARVSYRMMLEDSSIQKKNFNINTFLYDKAMFNLFELVTDQKLFGEGQAKENVEQILNAKTSAEVLGSYIDVMKTSLKIISNRGTLFYEVDGMFKEGKADINEFNEAYKRVIEEVKRFGNVAKTESENQRLGKELNNSLKKVSEFAEKLKEKTSIISKQKRQINNIEKNTNDNAIENLKSKMVEMEQEYVTQIDVLNETIEDLNKKFESLPKTEEALTAIMNKCNETIKAYEKLEKVNAELQEKYDNLYNNIKDQSLLDEASKTQNAIKKTLSFMNRNDNPAGNGFQAQISKIYNTFIDVTHNGVNKVIDPNEVFGSIIKRSFDYLGEDSTEVVKLTSDLFNLFFDAGLMDVIEGDNEHLVVNKSLESLNLTQINSLYEILDNMKKLSEEAIKNYTEKTIAERNEKQKAVVDNLVAKGSKKGVTYNDFLDNRKVGSEEWKKSNSQNMVVSLLSKAELLAPKLREIVRPLYNFIYGGDINGKYNDKNLNTAQNSEIEGTNSRFKAIYQGVANIFNKYEGTDKYTEKYINTHINSMLGETQQMGYMSLEDFENKNGSLSIKSQDSEVYSNYINPDLIKVADFVTSTKLDLERYERKKRRLNNKLNAIMYYYNISDNNLDVDTYINEYGLSESDANFMVNYEEKLDSVNNIIKNKTDVLTSRIGNEATYSMNSFILTFLASRQDDGIEHLLGIVTKDIYNAKFTGNNLSLGNILWLMDKFINDDSFKKYYEVANLFQEKISEKALEVEATKYREKQSMMKMEDNYFTFEPDPDSMFSFSSQLDESFDSSSFVNNDTIVSKTVGANLNATKKRDGGYSPLNLNATDILFNQISRQERYIAFAGIISDMQSLINPYSDINIISALQYGLGDNEGNNVVGLIKTVIDGITKRAKGDDISKVFSIVRNTQVYKSLALNISSAMLQSTAYLYVVDDIGQKNAIKYFLKYIKDSAAFGIGNMFKDTLSDAEQLIIKTSPQMSSFVNTDTMLSGKGTMESLLVKGGELLGDKNKGTKAAETFSSIKTVPFKFLDWMNRNIAFATYYAYFNTYLNEHPEKANDPEYIQSCANEATQKTLDITPNNFAKDTAPLYSTKDSKWKEMLLFTSQANKIFNKFWSKWQGRKYGDGNLVDVGKVVGLIVIASLANSVINGYIFSGDDDDENSIFDRASRYIAGETIENTIPFGTLVSPLIKGEGNYSNNTFNLLTKPISGETPNLTDFMNFTSQTLSFFELPGGAVNKIYRAFRDGTPLWLINYNWANAGR